MPATRRVLESLGRMPSGGGAMERDAVYYRRRLAEEKAAAIHAQHPAARAAHLEMAARYDERLSEIEASARQDPLHLFDVA